MSVATFCMVSPSSDRAPAYFPKALNSPYGFVTDRFRSVSQWFRNTSMRGTPSVQRLEYDVRVVRVAKVDDHEFQVGPHGAFQR